MSRLGATRHRPRSRWACEVFVTVSIVAGACRGGEFDNDYGNDIDPDTECYVGSQPRRACLGEANDRAPTRRPRIAKVRNHGFHRGELSSLPTSRPDQARPLVACGYDDGGCLSGRDLGRRLPSSALPYSTENGPGRCGRERTEQSYAVFALGAGLIFPTFGLAFARERSAARARSLYLASVVYLPLLLSFMGGRASPCAVDQ